MATEGYSPDVTRRRMGRRVAFWAAVVMAVAVLVSGAFVAIAGYMRQAGPGQVASGYFGALSHGDAAAALSYGALPPGAHDLLTREVLSAQLRIAPIRDVSTRAVHRDGDAAVVDVTYRLGFASGTVPVTDQVRMHHQGSRWRLDEAAVPVTLRVTRAQHRMSLDGAAVPSGPSAFFPGALPLTFDTSNLALVDDSRMVRFVAPGSTGVGVGVSPVGRRATTDAVQAAVTRCLTGGESVADAARCPVPDDGRAVPGTLRGRTTAPVSGAVTVSVADGPDGKLDVDGWVTVTGSYRRLDFENLATAKFGNAMVRLHATCDPTRVGASADAGGPVAWQVT